MNTHSKLHLVFENLKEQNKYLALKNNKTSTINVSARKNGNQRILFDGEIDNFNIGYYGAKGYQIRIEGISKSIELDKEKKYRVYQNVNLTLEDIINSVIKDYKKIVFSLDKKLSGKSIGKPIVQYNESDWEFIKRVASHLGMGIYNLGSGGINIGMNLGLNQKKQIAVEDNLWEMSKDRYEDIKYTLTSNYTILAGDEVELYLNTDDKKVNLVSEKGYLELKNGVTSSGVLMTQENYKYRYIPNKNIGGKVILGKVLKVVTESNIAKINVDMSIGLKQIASINYGEKNTPKKWTEDNSNERYNYPYVTPYSQSNTGLFCRPEINDIIAVYYPSEEEEEAYVMGSVKNTGSGRFNDPENRNYTLPIPEDMEKSGKDEPYFNFVVSSDTILVSADAQVELVSQEKIREFSGDKIELLSKNTTLNSKELLEVFSKNVDKRVSEEQSSIVNRKVRVNNSVEKIKSQNRNIEKFNVGGN